MDTSNIKHFIQVKSLTYPPLYSGGDKLNKFNVWKEVYGKNTSFTLFINTTTTSRHDPKTSQQHP
jgi:hypothetical protein